MQPSRHNHSILLHLLTALAFLLPILPPAGAKAAPAEKEVILTVVKNDTLSEISHRYLEETRLWRELAAINKLKNPHLIFPGQKLAIPISLLKGTPLEGTVTFVKGDARVQEKKGGEWRPLQMNDRVREGSGIRTGADSVLEITFEDGSSLFQEAETSLEMAASRQGPLHLLRELFLQGGRTLARLRNATGREQRAVIRTPSAVSAMRGTEVRVSSDAAATTRTEVMDGIVDVEALGERIAVRENEGTMVKKGEPPVAARKLLPPPEVIFHPDRLPLELRFTGIAGAAAYRVRLTRDCEGRDLVREETIAPDAPLTISDLREPCYYIRTMSIDADGITGRPSAPVPLQLGTHPPPPLLQMPGDGGEIRGQTVELKWLKVKGAATYRLQIAADRTFTQVLTDTAQQNVEYQAKALPFGRYFFRVRSVSAGGNEGAWSGIQEFAVVPPPAPPELEKPAPQEQKVRIRWNDLGPGHTYHWQVARDREFNEVIVDRQSAAPEIVFATPDAPGTYFVRISAIDAKGYEGDFSRPQAFQVERRFPYGWLLLVPVGVLALLAL